RSLARDHGADHVANRKRARAFHLGFTLGGERIGRFTRLRDDDCQGVGADNRVTVTELTTVVHLYRNSSKLFDHELAGERCMPARPAGHNANASKLLEVPRRNVHFIEEYAAALLADSPEQCVSNGSRLLKD